MKHGRGQLFLILCFMALCACGNRREETAVIPPVTSPLSRDYIGFGVITESFTHVVADPAQDSPSFGYLRRGSVVRIVRRQTIKTGNTFQSWVLIDDQQHGWLMEEVMEIYDSESMAKTASESMLK